MVENMNLCLKIFITLVFFSPCINSQQKYSGNAVINCTIPDESEMSDNFLYACNGHLSSCRAFVIFTAETPYNSVPTIAALTSSEQTELAKMNNVTKFTVFQTHQEVIVPVNCSCSGQYYEASTTYQVPTEPETYFTIAKNIFQGLSTCASLKQANGNHDEFSLLPGHKLRVPLRCACPSKGQTEMGTKYLLTYSIGLGDNLNALSSRFNVSLEEIGEANSFDDDYPIIYPFTTILIPLAKEPSSLSTTIRSYKPSMSPLPGPVFQKSRSSRGLIAAGVAAGALSGVIFLVLILILLFRKKKTEVQHRGGINTNMASREDLILEISRFDRPLKIFEFSDLKGATGNFRSRNRIKGGVYRTSFRKQVFAVKRTIANSHNEVKLLHQINHFNVVKLHGFCDHDDYFYLVYEYMKNGSLQDWLSKSGSSRWDQRIGIALDVANGLLYLHSYMSPAYVHNNITSSNILLDANLRAKIANFTRARKTNSDDATKFMSRNGYMAPECLGPGPVTPNVDVFAFGVVLLELISGKSPVFVQGGMERQLSATAADIMGSPNREAEIRRFLDPSLSENGEMEYAIQVVELSLNCLREDPADRPTMVEVVTLLLKVQFNIHKSIML